MAIPKVGDAVRVSRAWVIPHSDCYKLPQKIVGVVVDITEEQNGDGFFFHLDTSRIMPRWPLTPCRVPSGAFTTVLSPIERLAYEVGPEQSVV